MEYLFLFSAGFSNFRFIFPYSIVDVHPSQIKKNSFLPCFIIVIVTPQKYLIIFIIKIIIYSGYKLSQLGYFLGIVK